MATTKKKSRYVLQFALPWMEQAQSPSGKPISDVPGKPAYSAECAEALMRLMLCEMGPSAKGRIYSPANGKYRVLLHSDSEKEETFKTFDGREDRQ